MRDSSGDAHGAGPVPFSLAQVTMGKPDVRTDPILDEPLVPRDEATASIAPVTRLYQEAVNWKGHVGEAVMQQGQEGSPARVGTLVGQRWGQGGLDLEIKFPLGSRWVPAEQVRVPERKAPIGSLDLSHLPEVRAHWQEHLEAFPDNYPNLRPETWEAQSAATGAYNCVANSIHVERRPHWPGACTVDFDNLYGEHGYTPLGKMDWSLQEGVEKIVLFAVGPDDRRGDAYERVLRMIGDDDYYDAKCVCTHAIVQEPDGAFSSKMGGLDRIRVLDPNALADGFAGHPIRVYARLRP